MTTVAAILHPYGMTIAVAAVTMTAEVVARMILAHRAVITTKEEVMNTIQIFAAGYLIWLGCIMDVTKGGMVAKFVFKFLPVVLGVVLSVPVLKHLI